MGLLSCNVILLNYFELEVLQYSRGLLACTLSQALSLSFANSTEISGPFQEHFEIKNLHRVDQECCHMIGRGQSQCKLPVFVSATRVPN